MQVADYISIISIAVTVVIAIIGGVYAIVTNSKKYELAEQYKEELLTWYEKVVKMIIQLIFICKGGKSDENDTKRFAILSELSSLIEVGRFYFPNIDKKDNFGKHKPYAYRGYRHIALEFLVYIYEIGMRDDFYRRESAIYSLERQFTSIVYEFVKPDVRHKKLKKYTDIVMPNDMAIEDFLEKKQNELDSYEFWRL